jgi:hypothetical protein
LDEAPFAPISGLLRNGVRKPAQPPQPRRRSAERLAPVARSVGNSGALPNGAPLELDNDRRQDPSAQIHRGKENRMVSCGRTMLGFKSRRLRAGLGLAIFVIGSGFGIHLLNSSGPSSRSDVDRLLFMIGLLIWMLTAWWLFIEILTRGPAAGSSLSAWRPIDAADRQFGRGNRTRDLAPAVFRISPWRWIRLQSFPVLMFLGLNLLLWASAPLPWRHQSLVEQYMFAIFAVFWAVLNAALFLILYLSLHFAIGAWSCSFRLEDVIHRDSTRLLPVQIEGSFPLSLVAEIWVREKLSLVLKWKELHYGLTFTNGREMHLGFKTPSWGVVYGLDWERLLELLSRRIGIAITRKGIGE